jgi:hypothetical protein
MAGRPDYRTLLSPGDPAAIEQLVRDTGFFSTEEIAIARELADDGLANGPASHYRFVIAERNGALLGYTPASARSPAPSRGGIFTG